MSQKAIVLHSVRVFVKGLIKGRRRYDKCESNDMVAVGWTEISTLAEARWIDKEVAPNQVTRTRQELGGGVICYD